jgi:hypothetical protein
MEPLDTWCTRALPVSPEPRYTWQRQNPSYQGCEIRYCWARGGAWVHAPLCLDLKLVSRGTWSNSGLRTHLERGY